MMYLLRFAPGWLVIGLLLYVYVIKQADLIASPYILVAVISIGMLFSFVCSSIEMAIASLGQAELSELQQEADRIAARRTEMDDLEYVKAQMKVLNTLRIYYEAETLNAPIVICNNVANVIVAAFLPLALQASTQPTHWINISLFGPPIPIPGAGTETMTFFLTLFCILYCNYRRNHTQATRNDLQFMVRQKARMDHSVNQPSIRMARCIFLISRRNTNSDTHVETSMTGIPILRIRLRKNS